MFGAHGLSRIAERALDAAVEAIRLVPATDQTNSRLGGMPNLDDRPWPEHNGKPLAFVAQLDLSELARRIPTGGLPTEGLLSFFYAPEWDAPGYDPASRTGWQVYWARQRSNLRELPDNMSPLGQFAAVNVDFMPIVTLPSPRSNAVDLWELSEEESDRYDDLW